METIIREHEQDGASTTGDTDTVQKQIRSEADEIADPDRLLTILRDEDCRQLLAATATKSLTASELARRCDIPSSTVYRKIEQLLNEDLLEESMRVVTDGCHTKEYSLAIKEIKLSIVDREGLEFDFSIVK